VSHANARLTFHGRLTIVRRVRGQGRPKVHVAKEMGVSRKTVGYWVARHDAEGEAGLRDRSSRPRSSPRRISGQVEEQVLALREKERRGQDWLGPELGLAPRTVGRVLRRPGAVPARAGPDHGWGDPVLEGHRSAIRVRPSGELVHMDVKKIGRIPDGGGWKAHGRAMGRTRQRRVTRVGFDYVHSLVDDHSRLAYREVLPDEKGGTCAAFLTRAAAYFAAHGITRIQRVMTDNAWAYRYSLRHISAELGIKQIFIKPHCPWQNGKVERLNRTLQTEWAYRRAHTSNADRTDALAPWLEHYNTQRRHSALGGLPRSCGCHQPDGRVQLVPRRFA
jgi:transposase InsO family protein